MGGTILDLAKFGTELSRIKKAQDLQAGELDVARQRVGIEKRRADVELGTPGQVGTIERGARVQEIQAETMARQQDLAEKKLRQATRVANTVPKEGDINAIASFIPAISKQLFTPSLEKTTQPLINQSRQLLLR
jgi:hypothetical protein